MKLSRLGALALIVSIADAQPRTEQNLKAIPEAQHPHARPQTISADLVRQPLSSRAKQILVKAQHAGDAGDHLRAIEFLETAHAKYPESDAWTQSMLGVEYLKTRQFASALSALEQAVLLLPRDPVDRYNLGFALAETGQYERAEMEIRCALVLNHGEAKTRQLLDIVLFAETHTLPTRLQPVIASSDPCCH